MYLFIVAALMFILPLVCILLEMLLSGQPTVFMLLSASGMSEVVPSGPGIVIMAITQG
jgi:hypothetical protein